MKLPHFEFHSAVSNRGCRLSLGVTIGCLLALTGCNSKGEFSQGEFIYLAPAAVVPGTYMIGKMDATAGEAAAWKAVFSHRQAGQWVPDTSVSLAAQGFMILDQFHYHRFWSAADSSVDSFRIQVIDGDKPQDEMVLRLGDEWTSKEIPRM